MQNHQIERKNSRLSPPMQAARQGRGPKQLSDSGAILFDSLYEYSRAKSFDDAVCEFEALLDITKHHPGMREENAAPKLIVHGADKLQKCQAVKRSQALNN
jgi:hypothetical protein